MKRRISDRYLKVVEWSKEDQCYVGTSPGLIIGGVHGHNQAKVFAELCKAVEEVIQLLQQEGRALPAPTVERKCSGKILLRISQQLHKSLMIKALQEGKSINKWIQHELESSL